MIEDHYAKKIWLAPPQLYEMLRFFQEDLGDYDKLKSFVKNRSTKSIVRWLPVRLNCKDGIISVLPGTVHNSLSISYLSSFKSILNGGGCVCGGWGGGGCGVNGWVGVVNPIIHRLRGMNIG